MKVVYLTQKRNVKRILIRCRCHVPIFTKLNAHMCSFVCRQPRTLYESQGICIVLMRVTIDSDILIQSKVLMITIDTTMDYTLVCE